MISFKPKLMEQIAGLQNDDQRAISVPSGYRRAPTLEAGWFPDVSRIFGETQMGLSDRDTLYLKRNMIIYIYELGN